MSLGYKIAIWWDGDTSGDKRWYTGKVVSLGDSQTKKQIKYDSDGSLYTHDLATTRWAPALPTPELKCPWCGHVGMSGGTGGGGYAGGMNTSAVCSWARGARDTYVALTRSLRALKARMNSCGQQQKPMIEMSRPLE